MGMGQILLADAATQAASGGFWDFKAIDVITVVGLIAGAAAFLWRIGRGTAKVETTIEKKIDKVESTLKEKIAAVESKIDLNRADVIKEVALANKDHEQLADSVNRIEQTLGDYIDSCGADRQKLHEEVVAIRTTMERK